ncbi:hypothetical protein GCM10010182_19520 [Actinomadura cremea]|nr:hypothetical protein GCM10010182_19520 [Actinomadura cremea]
MEESRIGPVPIEVRPTASAYPRLVLTRVEEGRSPVRAAPSGPIAGARARRALGVSVVVCPVVGATVVIAPRMVAAARRWTSRRSSPTGIGGRGAAR